MYFGERIKLLREVQGLSQRALGEKMGVKQQTIAQYEKVKNAPKTETIEKIASALGVSSYVLTGDIPGLFAGNATKAFQEYLKHRTELNEKILNNATRAAQIAANLPDDFDYNITLEDKIVLEHSRPLNDDNLDKAIDYMAYLKDRQDQTSSHPDQDTPENK